LRKAKNAVPWGMARLNVPGARVPDILEQGTVRHVRAAEERQAKSTTRPAAVMAKSKVKQRRITAQM